MESKKLAELKTLCKERGLPTSGKKADLILRLTGTTNQVIPKKAKEPKAPKVPKAKNVEFRDLSRELTTSTSLTDRKDKGIFFTPKKARDRIWELLGTWTPQTVLEPSFGSGEFLLDANQRFPSATLYGVELEKPFFDKVQELGIPNIHLTNADFRTYESPEPVDFIVGNPPYFVVKDKEPACMKGRGNMFVLFIYWCLTKHLKEGGKLAFVLPTSFYNCSYYEPCRRFLAEKMTILHMETIDVDYLDTSQDTMILLVEKRAPVPGEANPFVWEHKGHLFLTPNAVALRELTHDLPTLEDLDFEVKTGDVVWNQERDAGNLSDTGVPVLYSTNIVNGRIVLNNIGNANGKKQYIQNMKADPVKGPAILISRGYGNKYNFTYGIVEDEMEFYGENHTNVIQAKTPTAMEHWERVKASLANPNMKRFLELFVGNGSLSKTEIQSLVPIFPLE